jgi:hypothetical protein
VCSLPSVVHRVFAEVGWGSSPSHEREAGGGGGGVGGGSMGSGGREGTCADDDTGNVRPNAALSTQDLEDSEMELDTSDSDGREALNLKSPLYTAFL